jgi:hypothetical protein
MIFRASAHRRREALLSSTAIFSYAPTVRIIRPRRPGKSHSWRSGFNWRFFHPTRSGLSSSALEVTGASPGSGGAGGGLGGRRSPWVTENILDGRRGWFAMPYCDDGEVGRGPLRGLSNRGRNLTSQQFTPTRCHRSRAGLIEPVRRPVDLYLSLKRRQPAFPSLMRSAFMPPLVSRGILPLSQLQTSFYTTLAFEPDRRGAKGGEGRATDGRRTAPGRRFI